MNAKQRIAQLEKTQANISTGAGCVVWWDVGSGDELATFDGVKMTQAEAEAKAAALPDNVLLIHVCYDGELVTE